MSIDPEIIQDPPHPDIPVIFKDRYLIVVNKPPDLLVIPSPKGESRTLTSLINRAITGHDGGAAHPCHRLDRETSGIILYAFGKSAQQKVMQVFHDRQVEKTYIALVNGVPGISEGMLRNPIEGRPAVTRFRVLGSGRGCSLVEVNPLTGRTNQIRIHFAAMGHPLVGDAKFGRRKDFAIPLKRTALHAWKLSFEHPFTGGTLLLQAPLPDDLFKTIVGLGFVTETFFAS